MIRRCLRNLQLGILSEQIRGARRRVLEGELAALGMLDQIVDAGENRGVAVGGREKATGEAVGDDGIPQDQAVVGVGSSQRCRCLGVRGGLQGKQRGQED